MACIMLPKVLCQSCSQDSPSPGTSETPGWHPYMRQQATRREILIEECKCFFCDKVGTEAAPLHDAMTPIMCPKSELQPGISRKEIPTLPESYTNLIHVTMLNEDVIISPVECTLTVNLSNLLWQTAAHRLVNE